MIDLRSDTVTRPTSEMLENMQKASVGDDVYGEDPTVNKLQERLSKMFGTEEGLFCPSGTMCNQIAINISTRPQDEVICDQYAHVYLYEGGGMAATSLVSVRLLEGDRMRLSPEQIKDSINADDPHYPRTSLVCLENTCNKGGGSFYTIEEIAAISSLCKEHGLNLHLDGARVFNALCVSGDDPKEYGKYFDTISVCLSKGLGAPVGSVLLGSKAMIKEAKRVRKRLGGGMRQAGYLAAAGIYALDHHVERLSEDHRRAKEIATVLESCDWVLSIMPVETNILIFEPDSSLILPHELIDTLKAKGILLSAFGKKYVRIVTHLDFTEEDLQRVCEILKGIAT